MTRKQRKSYSSHVVLIMLLMVSALLVMLALFRLHDFDVYQRSLMQNAVHTEANELAEKIARLQDRVALFAGQYYDIINYLAGYAGDEDVRRYLEERVARQFPDYFAISITDGEGKPYFEDFDLSVNEVCKQDLRNYVTNRYSNVVYIHPHPDVYHFDIMAPWGQRDGDTDQTVKGVFFVSFKPTILAESLKNSEIGEHRLLLLRTDRPGLIEVSSQGGRDEIPGLNGDYFLSEADQKRILYREMVPGTRWELVTLPDRKISQNQLRDVVTQSLLLFIAFALVSLISLRFIRHAEARRNASEQDLQSAKEYLQQALDFSRVIQCDWDIDTEEMRWSDNARELFKGALPASFSAYLQQMHEADRVLLRQDIDRCLETGIAYHNEHRLCEHDDTMRWIEASGNFEANALTGQVKMISLVTDITERKQAETRRIEAEKAQRDTLVREVHHRIKNHLQGVVGLLRQHTNKTPAIRDIIDAAVGQLYSVSSVYGLQSREGNSDVVVAELLKQVCKTTQDMTGAHIDCSQQEVLQERAILSDDRAVAIALILNELMANAVKHAPEPENASVSVMLVDLEGEVTISIENTIAGTPVDFDFSEGKGLGTGLSLIRSLLPGKGASLDITPEQGRMRAVLVLRTPVLKEDEA